MDQNEPPLTSGNGRLHESLSLSNRIHETASLQSLYLESDSPPLPDSDQRLRGDTRDPAVAQPRGGHRRAESEHRAYWLWSARQDGCRSVPGAWWLPLRGRG